MKKSERNNIKNLIRFFIIPLSLLFLWLGLTILYIITFDTSLSVLSYNHEKEHFSNISYDKLLKGDKISGKFTATEDNLGIVSIRFKTFIRPPYKNEDVLVFRIKEVGAKDWYYENNYRNGLIYDIPFFPFGFPKITHSKEKTYYFEIESLKGDTHNAVALSDRGQVLFSKYQIPKSLILQNEKEMSVFAVKKFISALLTTDVRFSSFIYLLPLLFYLLLISPFGKSQKEKVRRFIVKSYVFRFVRDVVSNKLHWIIILVVLIDIFLVQVINDIVYLVILFLWIAIRQVYSLTSKTTFLFTLSFLLIAPVCLFFKDVQTAEKAAAWAYIFLVAAMIQIFYELKKGAQPKNKRTKN